MLFNTWRVQLLIVVALIVTFLNTSLNQYTPTLTWRGHRITLHFIKYVTHGIGNPMLSPSAIWNKSKKVLRFINR